MNLYAQTPWFHTELFFFVGYDISFHRCKTCEAEDVGAHAGCEGAVDAVGGSDDVGADAMCRVADVGKPEETVQVPKATMLKTMRNR